MLKEASGLRLTRLSGRFHLTKERLVVEDPFIELPGTHINPGNLDVELKGWHSLAEQILSKPLHLELDAATVTPADFACFLPALEHYRQTVWLTADVSYYKGDLHLENLDVVSQPGISLQIKGDVSGLTGPVKDMNLDLPVLRVYAEVRAINSIVTDFVRLPESTLALIRRLGDVKVDAKVSGSSSDAGFDGHISVAQGEADIDATYRQTGTNAHYIKGSVHTSGFELGSLLDKADFGKLIADVAAEMTIKGKDVDGHATVDVPLFTYRKYAYSDIKADITKDGRRVEGEVHASDPNLDFDIEGSVTLADVASQLELNADVRMLNVSALNLGTPYDNTTLNGVIHASLTGNSLANVAGIVDASGLRFSSARYPEIVCENLYVESLRGELPHRLSITSDYFDVTVTW